MYLLHLKRVFSTLSAKLKHIINMCSHVYPLISTPHIQNFEMWDICPVKAMHSRAGQWQGTLEKKKGECCRVLHWVPHQGTSLSQAKHCFFLWKYLVVTTSLGFLNYTSPFISYQFPTILNSTSQLSSIFFSANAFTTSGSVPRLFLPHIALLPSDPRPQ